MKINRNTLLAGVATLALIAGSGFASAQEEHKGPAAPQANQPRAAAPANNHAAPAINNRGGGMQPQGASRTGPTPEPAAQRIPKENGRVGQSGGQPSAAPTRRNAQSVNRNNKTNNEGTTAQERNIPRGLQGNASGQMEGQHQLSEEQRTQIRRTVIDARGAPRVGHVDFDVSVGTTIPRGRVHIVPIPETLVQIDPGWSGFLYFVYEDEIVIVDPHDMTIVAILPV
jgi:Protein of unknown function (DUF1236)